jgi:2-polyprenyl-6-methoxyphenol hydroxylase-like FAD-dependent oxidoreductase
MSDFPTRHPYSLGIWQNQIERIMAAWIAELPVQIHYGREVTGFAQDDTGVDVELSDAQPLRAGISSGATEAVAASVKRQASNSRGGIRLAAI